MKVPDIARIRLRGDGPASFRIERIDELETHLGELLARAGIGGEVDEKVEVMGLDRRDRPTLCDVTEPVKAEPVADALGE